MIALLLVLGLGALALLVHNVFLSEQARDLIRERNEAYAALAEFAHTDKSVLLEVAVERQRQIRNGWTPEHDDTHSTHAMVLLADERIHAPWKRRPYTRAGLLQGVAILVAAIESMDRRTVAQDAFRNRSKR